MAWGVRLYRKDFGCGMKIMLLFADSLRVEFVGAGRVWVLHRETLLVSVDIDTAGAGWV